MFEPLSQVHPLLNGLGVGVALQVDAGLGGGDLSGFKSLNCRCFCGRERAEFCCGQARRLRAYESEV